MFIIDLHGVACPGKLIVPACEPPEHQCVGGIVEYRTHRTYENHEPLYVPDVPASWFLKKLLVHSVGRNSQLGKIIEQVIDKNLDRRHGQERKEICGADNAEHVPEI